MRSVVSMVGRVLLHESVQVALTEDDDSLEDLASTRTNPPFGDSVLPGTPVGRPDGVDAHPLERAVDIGAELGVAVEDEIAGSRVEWGDRKNKGVTATTCGQGRILRDVRLSQTRDAASPSPWRACRGQPSRVVRRITTRPPRGFVRRAGLGWAG